MKTADFDYQLPEGHIAQHPAQPRDSSRLMALNRASGSIEHLRFHQLPDLLRAHDVLVVNQTQVIPARLRAAKLPGGGRIELLLLARRGPAVWEAMVGGKGLNPGRRLEIDGGPEAEIAEHLGGPRRLVRFAAPISQLLPQIGETPLPPYIHGPVRHPDAYQTVYARTSGSAAAPTAGLHFTPALLEQIGELGVPVLKLTLHIGLDTFAPVTEQRAETHPIHSEWCRVPSTVVDGVTRCRASGGRVIAVGTTSVRALETAARAATEDQLLTTFEGPTDLFILPGHQFRVTDALITNFHLPRSTLLMLVSAFAGRDRILSAYQVAIEHGYRFYSFGDAMLIT